MKIGYISRRVTEDGKETFRYLEDTGTRRIGVRSDTVKVKFLHGTVPYEEIKLNTEIQTGGSEIVLVSEPFITDDALAERCRKWCDWANSCEHREYSLFGKLPEDDI